MGKDGKDKHDKARRLNHPSVGKKDVGRNRCKTFPLRKNTEPLRSLRICSICGKKVKAHKE